MSRLVAAALALVVLPGIAAANEREARTSYDVAVLVTRLDLGGGRSIPGRLVRFGPRIVIRDHFELGCDLDIGTVGGDVGAGAIARTTSGGTPTWVEGRISAAKMMAGGHWSAGRLAAGVDLALGLHAAELTDAIGQPVNDVWPAPIAEGRTHLDMWMTPHLTLGLAASMDLSTGRDVAIGLVVGLHPVAY